MTHDPSEHRPSPAEEPQAEDIQPTETDLRPVAPDQQPTRIDLRPVGEHRPTDEMPLGSAADEPAARVSPPPAPTPATDEEVLALRGTSFPVTFRGYNTFAVDRYVAQVEAAVARFEEHTVPTEAVRRALDRVGEQTAAILREAERSAEETTRASRAQADDRLQRAERESAALWAAAQARAASLDADIERLWQERQRLIEATRDLAARLRSTADEAEAQFPPDVAASATAPPTDGANEAAANEPPPRPTADDPAEGASSPPEPDAT